MVSARPLAWIAVLNLFDGCTDDIAGSADGPGSTGLDTTSAAPILPTTGADGHGTTGATTGAQAGTSTGAHDSTGDPSTGASSTGDASGMSSGTSGALDPCANGTLDPGETDVDCGGRQCEPCLLGAACLLDTDCASDACARGSCVAPACRSDADCAAASDACNLGVCDARTWTCAQQPTRDGQPCDDSDACTTGEACQAGACGGGAVKDCAAFTTLCGTGACDPKSGACFTGPDPKKDGLTCDDRNACTPATTCLGGHCGDPQDPGYVFHEDFSDPDPNWTLDQGWQIGPAVASPPGGGGTGSDPDTDHSPGDDNRLAGQFIGGLVTSANVTQGQFNCLTSPPFAAAKLGAVWLTFWRHLHVDYANFVVNRIEVHDGTKWVLVEEGYPQPVTNDPQWKQVTLDLTAHKSDAMRVRICHQRNNGAYFHAGWSVDDVTVAPLPCTP